ncbi:extracellular solute-binding protein [Paenibacillus xerothermodurans]|uniref:ABC transporter substrate-binding protein n=1 Tax=Paenibacillus xerothermodurans TaxID=1977292 RepID=A0A2W1NGL4_PAEXE|nr:extracellular solute-binding protein [Paenibacillus xerothermodurans]PZE22830.1 ABC transporter substrate-binding protein [Paenibacillus xerothermodurans]
MHVKNKAARLAGFSLVTVLLTGMLAGCSDGGSSADQGGANGEQVTLKIELFDRGNTPPGAPPLTESYFVKYIQEKFGDPNNIRLEFVTVPRTEEVPKLNVLMAANEAPDLIFTYNDAAVQNWVKQGGLTELDELLNQHGPNLKKYLGEELLGYGRINGKQYTIPSKRIILASQTPIIRKDWLDKLGMEPPETTEEFYEVLKAFKEKDPGNTGGKVIPYGIKYNNNLDPLVRTFWKPMTEEEYHTLPDLLKPGHKDGYRFLNKLYNENLISPDFALDKDGKKFQADFVNGLVGFTVTNTNEPVYMAYYSTLQKNVPDAKLLPIDPFTNYEGKHVKGIYHKLSAHLMIPKSSKRAVEAIKFLDWMSDYKVIFDLQNGTEGVTYKMGADGIPEFLDTDEAKKIMYNYLDYSMLINGKDMGDPDKTLKANAADPKYKDFTMDSIRIGEQDGQLPPRFDRPIEAQIKYNQTLTDKAVEIYVKTVTAKPADFDKLYDDMVAEYLTIGGKEVMEEQKKAYMEMKKK